MRVLNRDQAATLLQATAGTDLGDVVLMAVHSGLRLGELLAVRWSDLDLGTGELRIQQTVIRLKGGQVTFGQPKTHRSRRAVSVATSVLEMLRRRRAEQVEQARLMGPAYVSQGLAFADALGGVLDQDRLRRRFYAELERNRLPRIRLHDLRHTAATLLLGLGVHPKIVSERLGHSTVNITLDTYSHVLPGLQAEAAKRLDDWLAEGSTDENGGGVVSISDLRSSAAEGKA
ncbi:MAG: site-specific integrase [Chloroflexi bacterium]|nr:site-specific integrase [Chloroflexota bacterium]